MTDDDDGIGRLGDDDGQQHLSMGDNNNESDLKNEEMNEGSKEMRKRSFRRKIMEKNLEKK